jgi:3-isopropylmalate/(R)-2-methylmalate dehydratase large subunit
MARAAPRPRAALAAPRRRRAAARGARIGLRARSRGGATVAAAGDWARAAAHTPHPSFTAARGPRPARASASAPARSPASTGKVREGEREGTIEEREGAAHAGAAPRTPAPTSSPPPSHHHHQVTRPMTLTEKILANHTDAASVRPGDNIWTTVDKLMTHDVCGPGTFGIFQKEFGENAKVWDPERVVIIPDHYIFTTDARANRNVDILRDMVKQYGIKYFYDITDRADFKANPDYKGVCHVALAQEGHCKPGEVLLGTDSHTCNAGAFGQFATGVGNTDAGFVLGTGRLLVKVPPAMRFVLDGELPPYLMAKDLILQIIGEIGVAGGTYKAMEFSG